ncbi:hypothetical protein M0D45_01150 [Xanthomonas prunicola]|uniref:hypothetical protein n=1 Tax=Xanthomonas prunicola TaxID=2053930 RepID=UPI0021B1A3DC|nr:hypothetical protein [Xanthomonas prunicola]UXA53442.1 hypothetical protein M0D45_01150 [Xanthomonas prunicola]
MSEITSPSRQILLLSNCFADEVLAIDAAKLGLEQQGECQNCRNPDEKKLTLNHLRWPWRAFLCQLSVDIFWMMRENAGLSGGITARLWSPAVIGRFCSGLSWLFSRF